MAKGIIFDLDGTLLDTLTDLKEAVNYALRTLKLQELTLQQVRSFVGNGVRNLVERSLLGKVEYLDEAFELFKGYYDKHMTDYTRPYDGIVDMIKSVSDLGFKMAIVSNKYQLGVETLCTPLFSKWVKVFVGSQENMRLKPAPDMPFYACKQLGLKPEECIFVGDSDVDAKTGQNSNMKVIGVTWGFKDEKVLLDLNVKLIAHTVEELLDIIKGEKENG